MRSLARLLVALIGLTVPAWAATYYFSDCATGGSGTIGDPYCLDPLSAGSTQTYNMLFDGVNSGANKEAVAGDTIYLCAGACDGAGSTTIRPTPRVIDPAHSRHSLCDNRKVLWLPTVCGTNGSTQITLAGYPGESVTISGDTDQSGLIVSGADNAISSCDTLVPDPCPFVTVQNLHFVKVKKQFIHGYKALNDWTVTHNEFNGNGVQGLWDGLDFTTAGCDNNGCGDSAYAVNVSAITTNFTFSYNTIHDVAFATRFVDNPAATQILSDHNIVYNVSAGSNDFNDTNLIQQNWNLTDFSEQGFSEENDCVGCIVQDNTVGCLGVHKVRSDWGCNYGITVSDGDTPGNKSTQYHSKGLIVRRNKVFGVGDGKLVHGTLRIGIAFTASCLGSYPVIPCTHGGGDHQGTCGGGLYCDGSSGGVDGQCFPSGGWSPCTYNQTNHVEDNEVWNEVWMGDTPDGKSYASAACYFVNTPNATVIANNSARGCGNASFAIFGATNHIVANNLIPATNNGGAPWSPLMLETGFTAADLTHNAVYDENATVVGGYCSLPCDSGANAAITKANLASLGDGTNFVGLPTFVKCDTRSGCGVIDTNPANWDLHIDMTDHVAQDKGENTDCPATDIDGQKRPWPISLMGGLCDLGADETFVGTPGIFPGPCPGGVCAGVGPLGGAPGGAGGGGNGGGGGSPHIIPD